MNLSGHGTRWLIAVVLAPILLWIIMWVPAWVFFLLVLVAGSAAWNEYHAALLAPDPRLWAVGLGGWGLTAVGAHLAGPTGAVLGLAAAAVGGGLYHLIHHPGPAVIDRLGRFSLGLCYAALLFSFALFVFSLPFGRFWILFSLLVTFLGDAAAYYVGSTLGRRPLYPEVSPKKTCEGFWGGVAGYAATAAVFGALFLPAHWTETLGLGLFLGVWGAAGELFQSMLKRAAGIKDSGRILMGHGGVWDRVDALLFNLPAVYFFGLLFSGQTL